LKILREGPDEELEDFLYEGILREKLISNLDRVEVLYKKNYG
jgi:hypothetical protein